MADVPGIVQGNFAGIPALLQIPEVRAKIVDLYRRQKLFELLQWLGPWKRVDDDKYYTARSQPGFYTIDTTGATITGTTVLTITGLAAPQRTKAIVGDTLELPNGQQVRIQTVTNNGADMSIANIEAGNASLVLVAGGVMRQYSNAQEEGSEAPQGRNRGVDYIYNQLGIFRKSSIATDVQKMKGGKRLLVEVDGQHLAYYISEIQQYLQHRAEIAAGLFKHRMSDPNFSNANPSITGVNGRGVQTTRGIIPTFNTYGSAVPCAVAGAPSLTDWENIAIKRAQVDGPDHYVWIGSTASIVRASSALKGLGSANTSNVRINLGKNDTMVDFTLERFIHGSITHDFFIADVLDLAELFPTTGADYKSLFGMPVGNYPILSSSGEATGNDPYFQVRYGAIREPGVGTEMEAEIRLGALAPTPTNGTNVDQKTWCSAVGTDTSKPESLIKMTGVLV